MKKKRALKPAALTPAEKATLSRILKKARGFKAFYRLQGKTPE